MKLLRFGPQGQEKPGVLDSNGVIRSLEGVIEDLAGESLIPESLARLKKINPSTLPTIECGARLGPCVSGVGKFICIGLNYKDHVAESGMEAPKDPVIFMKATSAIVGPNDDIKIPLGSLKTDWEVELGVVIGDKAHRIDEKSALGHVAGYCVINDLSEREYQLEHGGQWVKGKSCDTFGPIGPWLVTSDEVADPQSLRLWLEVDGHRYQDGTTNAMIFGVAKIVSYVSQYMTLLPGDIISTGTPCGVGLGQNPPMYLRPGQNIHLGIDGLGEQSQNTISE